MSAAPQLSRSSGPAERVRVAPSPVRISSNVRFSITSTISDDSATTYSSIGMPGDGGPGEAWGAHARERDADAPVVRLSHANCLTSRRSAVAAALQFSVGMKTRGRRRANRSGRVWAGRFGGGAMTRAALTAAATAFALAVAATALTLPARAQAPVEQGQRYFMNSGGHGCHTVAKMATPIGPDLSEAGAQYAHTDLAAQ